MAQRSQVLSLTGEPLPKARSMAGPGRMSFETAQERWSFFACSVGEQMRRDCCRVLRQQVHGVSENDMIIVMNLSAQESA